MTRNAKSTSPASEISKFWASLRVEGHTKDFTAVCHELPFMSSRVYGVRGQPGACSNTGGDRLSATCPGSTAPRCAPDVCSGCRDKKTSTQGLHWCLSQSPVRSREVRYGKDVSCGGGNGRHSHTSSAKGGSEGQTEICHGQAARSSNVHCWRQDPVKSGRWQTVSEGCPRSAGTRLWGQLAWRRQWGAERSVRLRLAS